jgi:hypothetical protein
VKSIFLTNEESTTMSIFKLVTTIALAGVITLMTSSVYAKERTKGRGAPGIPVIYVASQDLFYDTLLLGALPYNGTDNFQELVTDGAMAPYTEFGPNDTGYFGGRWWVDAEPLNGYMDENDVYFLCPLLGPGRTEP